MFSPGLNFDNYFSLIDEYLVKNPPPSEEEISKIQKQFGGFSLAKEFSSAEKTRIFEDLTTISKTRPGYELLRRLLEKLPNLEFKKGKPEHENKRVLLDPFMKKTVAVVEDKTHRLGTANSASDIVLAHELIHSLHSLRRDEWWGISKNPLETSGELINPEMDTEEEQHTIAGILILKDGSIHFDPINQNTIARALGHRSFRINHRSITIAPEECRFVDKVVLGIFKGKNALANVKSEDYFSELNATNGDRRLLTICFRWDKPLFKKIFKIAQVELNFKDANGTLFENLLSKESWDFLLKLIADPRFKTSGSDLELLNKKIESSGTRMYDLQRVKALYLKRMEISYKVDQERLEQIYKSLEMGIQSDDFDGLSALLEAEVFLLFQMEAEGKKIDPALKPFVQKMKEAARFIWNDKLETLCEKVLGFT